VLSPPTLQLVPSLDDVVRGETCLDEADLRWLTALVGEWQLLSDLSFADLVLWLPRSDGTGFVAGAQMRPTTGPTSYADDLVGRSLTFGRRPLIDAAYENARIRRDSDPEWWESVPVRMEAIPVVREGRVLAVIGRTTNLVAARTPSRLELVYLEAAGLLARMIAEGRFPQAVGSAPPRRGAPRVGDGLVRLDAQGRVTFASPNAMSAYRRLGLVGDLVGQPLGPTTRALQVQAGTETVDEGLDTVLSGSRPRLVELDSAAAVLTVRTIPLNPNGVDEGAIALVRDVTELRRRDQELMTKDATIREIHHRVKNNLQTVASLLRLQSRRVPDPAARAALVEAVRRVGSIAVVHEMLAETADDEVDLDDVLGRLTAMVAEVAAPEHGQVVERRGRAGRVPASVATPLALAVTELLHNAMQHGLGDRPGRVELVVDRAEDQLTVLVEDDGTGLPAGFDLDTSDSLGLRIVSTLICERGGSVSLVGADPGTRAVVALPL
jgi:two-component sensor histidine kinase/PAS domain-containing protein